MNEPYNVISNLRVLNNCCPRRFHGIIDCFFNEFLWIHEILVAIGKYCRKQKFKKKTLALFLVNYGSMKDSYSAGSWSFYS
jgi:hypothetical protein